MEVILFVLGTPTIAVIWFLVSIILYIKCSKEETEKKKKRRNDMLISGVVAVLLVSALIWLMVMLSRAVEHM